MLSVKAEFHFETWLNALLTSEISWGPQWGDIPQTEQREVMAACNSLQCHKVKLYSPGKLGKIGYIEGTDGLVLFKCTTPCSFIRCSLSYVAAFVIRYWKPFYLRGLALVIIHCTYWERSHYTLQDSCMGCEHIASKRTQTGKRLPLQSLSDDPNWAALSQSPSLFSPGDALGVG